MGQNLNDVQLAISDLEHFYYTWFAPRYSETISFGVVVRVQTGLSGNIYFIYLYSFLYITHHTCFYTFSFFRNRPVNFQATLLILSNYSVNVYVLGLYHKKIGGLRANIWSQGTVISQKVIKKERPLA